MRKFLRMSSGQLICHHMNSPLPPLALQPTAKKKPTNLNLTTSRVTEGHRIAKERYSISFSEMMDRLLDKEIHIKLNRRGLLHRTFNS